jgi:hypothetical protein
MFEIASCCERQRSSQGGQDREIEEPTDLNRKRHEAEGRLLMQPTGVLSRRRESRKNAEGEEQDMKLSEMAIGDKAFFQGAIVELRDNGKQGGCEFDLWLSYVCDDRDAEVEGYADLLTLDTIDRDDVSGIED